MRSASFLKALKGNRTPTGLRPSDWKSDASTYFAMQGPDRRKIAMLAEVRNENALDDESRAFSGAYRPDALSRYLCRDP